MAQNRTWWLQTVLREDIVSVSLPALWSQGLEPNVVPVLLSVQVSA